MHAWPAPELFPPVGSPSAPCITFLRRYKRQLVAGEGDGLAVEAGVEDDRVAAAGGLDRIPQGPGPFVEVVRHRKGAGNGPIFEAFETRHERWPPAGRPL